MIKIKNSFGIFSPHQDTFVEGFSNRNNILIVFPNSVKEALWAAEQCLKSGACSAVLFWCQSLEVHQVRRFQVAAEAGSCVHFFLIGQTFRV